MGHFPWLCQISIGYIGISWYIPIKSLWLRMNSHFFMSLGTSNRNSSKDFSHCCPLPQALIMADCRITSGERSAPAAGGNPMGFFPCLPMTYFDLPGGWHTSITSMSKKQVLAGDLKVFQPLFAVHLTNFTTNLGSLGLELGTARKVWNIPAIVTIFE